MGINNIEIMIKDVKKCSELPLGNLPLGNLPLGNMLYLCGIKL